MAIDPPPRVHADDVEVLIREALASGATSLTIPRSHGLTTLPASLGELTTLRSLFVRNNRLVEISDVVKRLVNLEIIDIGSNDLHDLPASLADLPHLKEIHATAN